MSILSARAPIAARRLLFALLPAIALVGLACGDETGPIEPDVPVATLVLAGAPDEALRVGETVQLAATALSETGSTISGADVSWSSSDRDVATVSRGGLVTAVGAGRATVTASSGTGVATAEILVVAALTLGPSGGTVSLPDGSLSLTVPSGMLPATVTFLVGPAPASLATPGMVPGSIFEISSETPQGYFTGNLTLRYDPAQLPAGTTEAGLQLYVRTQSGWRAVHRSASNPANNTVTGPISAIGTYAIRFTPVDRVALTGAQVDGALYVGQSTRFGAVPLSATGDTLANRTATWTTSAAAIATVDAEGTVRAIGVGTATITATSEGTSATTQVVVLSRPVASWPTAIDWTTFRGNNRRTGYLDVTLDPVSFARRWEVTVTSTSTLNEPATGDGNVYVSTNAYFGGQAIYALNTASGVTRWTRAFGDIHSVNGPATGNGRVYVSTGGHQDSFLWSFDAADGTVRFRSAYGNQWSRWQAPAVTSDVVFLGGGYYGGMVAYDALAGTQLWRRDLPQEDGWTPSTIDGKAYAFGYESSRLGLLMLDARTGAATIAAPDLGLPTSGTPVIGSSTEVFAIRGSRLLAIDVARNVIAWSLSGQYQGVPALDDANVYAVVNGQVEARLRTTGALVWTWVPQPGSIATGSVIVTRNILFVRLIPSGYSTTGGRVAALDLATRRIVWSYEADGEIALGDGLLLVTRRTGGMLTAIAVR